MSLIKAIKAQLGLSVTPGNNFVLDASADNGTMKLARGNAGATTQDIMTVDAAGKVAFPQGVIAPAGTVLQQLLFTDNGSTSLPGTISNVTQSAKNIIPKSTNSKIHVAVSFYGAASSGGTFINTQLHEASAGAIGAMNSHGLTLAGNQAVGGWTQQAIFDNTSLVQKSFTLWANDAVGGGGAVTHMVWTLTEVQN